MDELILTQEGLDRFKAELHDVVTVKAPEARKELDEIRVIWSGGDEPYEDAKNKCDFYCHRIGYLQRAINNAVWHPEKGFYKTKA